MKARKLVVAGLAASLGMFGFGCNAEDVEEGEWDVGAEMDELDSGAVAEEGPELDTEWFVPDLFGHGYALDYTFACRLGGVAVVTTVEHVGTGGGCDYGLW